MTIGQRSRHARSVLLVPLMSCPLACPSISGVGLSILTNATFPVGASAPAPHALFISGYQASATLPQFDLKRLSGLPAAIARLEILTCDSRLAMSQSDFGRAFSLVHIKAI